MVGARISQAGDPSLLPVASALADYDAASPGLGGRWVASLGTQALFLGSGSMLRPVRGTDAPLARSSGSTSERNPLHNILTDYAGDDPGTARRTC